MANQSPDSGSLNLNLKRRIAELQKPASQVEEEYRKKSIKPFKTEVGLRHPEKSIGLHIRDDGSLELFAGDAKIILDQETGAILLSGNHLISNTISTNMHASQEDGMGLNYFAFNYEWLREQSTTSSFGIIGGETVQGAGDVLSGALTGGADVLSGAGDVAGQIGLDAADAGATAELSAAEVAGGIGSSATLGGAEGLAFSLGIGGDHSKLMQTSPTTFNPQAHSPQDGKIAYFIAGVPAEGQYLVSFSEVFDYKPLYKDTVKYSPMDELAKIVSQIHI